MVFGVCFDLDWGSAEILAATSVMRPRADVAYCIHALSRRLSKTHNWTVCFDFVPNFGFFFYLVIVVVPVRFRSI